jgi:hypothetical protein
MKRLPRKYRLRYLKKLGGNTLSTPDLPLSDAGYFDKFVYSRTTRNCNATFGF